MLLGIFIMPISLHLQILGHWALKTVLCKVWLAMDVFLCTASTLSLVVISVDRYWSVTNALEYPQLRTAKKVNIGIVGIWLTSALVSLPPLAGWQAEPLLEHDAKPQCNLSDELGYIIYSLTISFYIPLIIIFIAYGRIFQVARRRGKQHIKLGTIQNTGATGEGKETHMTAMDARPSTDSNNLTENSVTDPATCSEQSLMNHNIRETSQESATHCDENEHTTRKLTFFASRFMHRSSKINSKDIRQVESMLRDQQQAKKLRNQRARERRATITIAVIVLAFAVCWLPFSLVYLTDRICNCGMRETKAFAVIFWLGYCNSAVNPVLYSIFNRDFRHAFMRLLCKQKKGW
ncbi:alpha-2C adrenergic receptor-like [Watersipora subatra]|uniref:alpha-2C adrenergic receptor-like n=1 Tax=Watersipora subatra TaxID=2589382 RepID=UPI00355C53F3